MNKRIEEIWDNNHRFESGVGWSNLAGGFIEKSQSTEKEKGIRAMKEAYLLALSDVEEKTKLQLSVSIEKQEEMCLARKWDIQEKYESMEHSKAALEIRDLEHELNEYKNVPDSSLKHEKIKMIESEIENRMKL